MTDRQTDAEFTGGLVEREHKSPTLALLFAAREADRARHSEEALLSEAATKDAQLTALADALYGTGYVDRDEWHTEACRELGEHGVRCAAAVAALRLVGRLP